MEKALSTAPIAAKLITKLKIAGRWKAASLLRVTPDWDMGDLHPVHAMYVNAFNVASVISERISELKPMAPFVDLISEADETYLPQGPPMSPLTGSYFNSWALFDACVGPANETIATIILDLAGVFGMDPEWERLIRLLQQSRMGVYLHRGVENGLAILEEPITGIVHHGLVPAGYLGQKDELWFVRVLPPPTPGGEEAVVHITPYVLIRPGLREWLTYFGRAIAPNFTVADYENHMKFGPSRNYWNEFIVEAYVNNRKEVIYLAGVPDIPESLPLSKVSQRF